MKNKFGFVAILSIMLVFGLVLIGCPDLNNDDSTTSVFDGTWVNNQSTGQNGIVDDWIKITIDGNNWTEQMRQGGTGDNHPHVNLIKGTLSKTNENTAILTVTHGWAEEAWTTDFTKTLDVVSITVNEMLVNQTTFTATVSDNVLSANGMTFHK
jgi:hypothetical protein